MSREAIPLVIGAVCYALATSYEIRITSQRTVATASVLAPPIALVALDDGLPLPFAALAPVLAVVLLVALRKPARRVVAHGLLYVLVLIATDSLGRLGVTDELVRALLGAVLYLSCDYAAQRFRSERPLSQSDRRTWLWLHGVLICACGITALGVDRMDWPAFVAMALVLVLTKREFEAFALSRAAYDQTIAAIETLKRLDADRPTGGPAGSEVHS